MGAGNPARAAQVSLLVVDDHEVVHWGLRSVLGAAPWVARCLAAHDGAEALELARRFQPQVAIVDLFVGTESGADISQRLRAISPDTKVLLISGAGRISAAAARAAGAAGFISKDSPAEEIVQAVRQVAQGRAVFDAGEANFPGGLSAREREVLGLMATGATNAEIAAQLFLSPHTVKDHASALYRKLGVRNRAEAVQRSQQIGLTA